MEQLGCNNDIMTCSSVEVEVVRRQFHFAMKMKQLCTHNRLNIKNSEYAGVLKLVLKQYTEVEHYSIRLQFIDEFL